MTSRLGFSGLFQSFSLEHRVFSCSHCWETQPVCFWTCPLRFHLNDFIRFWQLSADADKHLGLSSLLPKANMEFIPKPVCPAALLPQIFSNSKTVWQGLWWRRWMHRDEDKWWTERDGTWTHYLPQLEDNSSIPNCSHCAEYHLSPPGLNNFHEATPKPLLKYEQWASQLSLVFVRFSFFLLWDLSAQCTLLPPKSTDISPAGNKHWYLCNFRCLWLC